MSTEEKLDRLLFLVDEVLQAVRPGSTGTSGNKEPATSPCPPPLAYRAVRNCISPSSQTAPTLKQAVPADLQGTWQRSTQPTMADANAMVAVGPMQQCSDDGCDHASAARGGRIGMQSTAEDLGTVSSQARTSSESGRLSLSIEAAFDRATLVLCTESSDIGGELGTKTALYNEEKLPTNGDAATGVDFAAAEALSLSQSKVLRPHVRRAAASAEAVAAVCVGCEDLAPLLRPSRRRRAAGLITSNTNPKLISGKDKSQQIDHSIGNFDGGRAARAGNNACSQDGHCPAAKPVPSAKNEISNGVCRGHVESAGDWTTRKRGAATRRPLSRFDKRGDLHNEGGRSISGGCKSGLASNCTCVGANSTANGTANGSSSDQDGVKLSMEQAGLAVGKLKMALA